MKAIAYYSLHFCTNQTIQCAPIRCTWAHGYHEAQHPHQERNRMTTKFPLTADLNFCKPLLSLQLVMIAMLYIRLCGYVPVFYMQWMPQQKHLRLCPSWVLLPIFSFKHICPSSSSIFSHSLISILMVGTISFQEIANIYESWRCRVAEGFCGYTYLRHRFNTEVSSSQTPDFHYFVSWISG